MVKIGLELGSELLIVIRARAGVFAEASTLPYF